MNFQKHFFLTTLSILTILLTNVFASEKEDREAIRQTISYFVQSGDTQSSKLGKKSLHEDCKQIILGNIGETEKGFMEMPTSVYLKMLDEKKIGGDKRTFEISSLEVSNQTASAKVKIYSEKHTFTDFISLAKFGNEWKIIGILIDFQSEK
ncbi:MAG: hypothetical protein DWQ06_06665 [Calditrichaeota bacterium]|nr:MAG: hypothetical protein DWQ06_06665 [Calditrichota bacterium]